MHRTRTPSAMARSQQALSRQQVSSYYQEVFPPSIPSKDEVVESSPALPDSLNKVAVLATALAIAAVTTVLPVHSEASHMAEVQVAETETATQPF